MCTAVSYLAKHHYFGRNLDFEHSFRESVTVTPRNFLLSFRKLPPLSNHYAMIGMAMVEDGYPLYYDATNEKGLSMAGLYFPGNAVYLKERQSYDNITPFELIPWVLGQCADMAQVQKLLQRLNLIDIPFNSQLPLSPLHWIIADSSKSLTVEPTADGIQVYENPLGVLTNNPPFHYHLHNLSNYMNLTREEPENRFAPQYTIKPYSRGMGAMGLPGDLSSASRFVRAVFVKANSVCEDTDIAGIHQFFHILGAVAQQNGCAKVGDGYEKTIYTSCCNTDTGIYYYTTYDNFQITGVSMHHTDLDSTISSYYPLRTDASIVMEN